MPTVQIINVNNPSFDFMLKNLNINFVGLSVSNPNTIYNTSMKDTLYVLNKNTKSVLFNELKLKDVVLRNRNLTANDKNLIATVTETKQIGDLVSITYSFQFKKKTIGTLEIKYPYSYYSKENSLILPFQSFPIQAIYRVVDPGILINHYYGQSITESDRKTGTMDINFIVSCTTKDGIQINEDTTISVNLINGGFVRPVGGGATIGSGADGDTAWRAKASSAGCVVNAMTPMNVYGVIEMQNQTTYDNYFPDSSNWMQRTHGTRGDMVLKFYSDSGLTTPLTLVNQTVNVFVYSQNQEEIWNSDGLGGYTSTTSYYDSVQPFTINNVSGNNVVLATNVDLTTNVVENLAYESDPTPQPQNMQSNTYTYELFPNSQIVGGRTGYKEYATLEQYFVGTNLNTGVTKPNSESDADYIAPVEDSVSCPVTVPVTNVALGETIRVTSLDLVTGGITEAASFPFLPYLVTGSGSSFVAYNRPGLTTLTLNATHTGANGSVPGFVRVTVSHAGGTQTINVPKAVTTTVGSFTNITNINISKW